MSEESKNSGFGNRARLHGERLVNKDGSFNVVKTGRSFVDRFNLYHWFLHMSWLKFVLVIFVGYFFMNCLFASFYFMIGVEHLQGTIWNTPGQKFLSALYFSAQTFTTVGYGRVNPVGHWANVVASIEALVGLMGFAVMTGLIYGRFSKPRAEIMFSKSAIISPFKEIKGLMFRMANARDSQMSDVSITVILAKNETINGQIRKKFYPIELELRKIFFFATTWTVVHPLDDKSPLKDYSVEDFEKEDIELLIQVSGYDDTFSQIVNDRTSYKWKEIQWNVKFAPILDVNEEGRPRVKLEELSNTHKID